MSRSLKVLVVDDNQALVKSTVEVLRSKEKIERADYAFDGYEAVEMMTDNEYDALLLDIIMPKLDGFGVLEQLKRLNLAKRPAIVVISAMKSDEMVIKSLAHGADYFMMKPYSADDVYERIVDLCFPESVPSAPPQRVIMPAPPAVSLDEKITGIFLVIGIPAHIKGYHFLREAVRQIYANPDMINRITKELYPGIARRYNTSASKVERAIRHAIEVAWTRGKIENINQVFGYNIYTKNDKPTNGEFIALVADKLILESKPNRGDYMKRPQQKSFAL